MNLNNTDSNEITFSLENDLHLYDDYLQNQYSEYEYRDYDCQVDEGVQTIADANALITSFHKTKKNSNWKSSIHHYEANLLKNTYQLKKELETDTYKQRDFHKFTINERGKTRCIKSLDIRDRVVQRSLCDNVLSYSIFNTLIHDNGACVPNKGISFSEERLCVHLQRYYRKYGNKGYVLKIDYSKFFDNVVHSEIMRMLSERLKSQSVISLCRNLISSFDIDVSYMSDDEFKNCYTALFNSLEYVKINPKLLTGEKIMHKSLGIGSQISQLCGLLYLSEIDHYCKCCLSLEFYGRYADDLYILHPDKKELANILDTLITKSTYYGQTINRDKTQIINMNRYFTFLKIQYKISDTGKIIKIPARSKIISMQRKIKSYKKLVDDDKMTIYDAFNNYRSWRGNMEKYDCYKSLLHVDDIFYRIFGIRWNDDPTKYEIL